MKARLFLTLTLFLVSTLSLTDASAKNYTQWHLPKEAKARIGKGWISSNIAFSPNNNLIAVGTSIGTWIYDAQTGGALNLFTGHMDVVSGIAFSPDGKTLATGGGYDDKTVQLWDVETGKLKATLTGHTSRISSIVFSPDGEILATGGGWVDTTVRLWHVATLFQGTGGNLGEPKAIFTGHTRGVNSVAFHPDGEVLVSGSSNTICLWDITTGTYITTLAEGARSVVFSSDGYQLASSSGDRVILWDAASLRQRLTITGHLSGVSTIAFSPDSRTLASGGWDRKVHLWDIADGNNRAPLIGHTSDIVSVSFSPDGKTLASSGSWADPTIRLWDATSGTHKGTLIGHRRRIESVAFSPDGKMLASASRDGTILLWEFPLAQRTAGAPLLSAKDPNNNQVLNAVGQNYPNPFNPETWIPYQLAASAEVTVHIYTANGTLIRTLAVGHRPASVHTHQGDAVYWDGKNEFGESVASGVYFYTLSAGNFRATRKMLIQK